MVEALKKKEPEEKATLFLKLDPESGLTALYGKKAGFSAGPFVGPPPEGILPAIGLKGAYKSKTGAFEAGGGLSFSGKGQAVFAGAAWRFGGKGKKEERSKMNVFASREEYVALKEKGNLHEERGKLKIDKDNIDAAITVLKDIGYKEEAIQLISKAVKEENTDLILKMEV